MNKYPYSLQTCTGRVGWPAWLELQLGPDIKKTVRVLTCVLPSEESSAGPVASRNQILHKLSSVRRHGTTRARLVGGCFGPLVDAASALNGPIGVKNLVPLLLAGFCEDRRDKAALKYIRK